MKTASPYAQAATKWCTTASARIAAASNGSAPAWRKRPTRAMHAPPAPRPRMGGSYTRSLLGIRAFSQTSHAVLSSGRQK